MNGTNLMRLAIGWIMSTEQFAGVRMIEFHTDARRCVAMSRGIDKVDALQFLLDSVLKLDIRSPGGFCHSLVPNSLGSS